MRKYNVHFSFYAEEYGSFDDNSYSVMAEDIVEARIKAWEVCSQDKETLFRSNIKEFAVTWLPNILDAGDYFYSCASDIKQEIGRIKNVRIPNSQIAGPRQEYRHDVEKYSGLESLYTIDSIAKDLYADKGIVPPSIYEELLYAEKLCEYLGWDARADSLWDRMDKAKKWDRGAILGIRDLFQDRYTVLNGETVLFSDQFVKNGIFPFHSGLEERDYTYIARWKNKRAVDRLEKLPVFRRTDVIKNSAGNMDYEWQPLLLDFQRTDGRYQTADSQLWQIVMTPEGKPASMTGDMVLAENLITGEQTCFGKDNFLGVLRPDLFATLNFEVLKTEYAAAHSMEAICNEVADCGFLDLEEDGEEER